MKINFSVRYGVMGIYKDQEFPVVRIYPVPFVRITVGGTDNIARLKRWWYGG